MFNEEMKKKFMDYSAEEAKDNAKKANVADTTLEIIRLSNYHRVKSLFNKMDPYEQELGKDISEFSQEEILSAFSGLKVPGAATLRGYREILSGYISFLNKGNTEIPDTFAGISNENLESCTVCAE